MKFLVLASALAAVAQAAIEPNTAFGLITLRSASPVHLLSPSVDTDGRLVVNGSKNYFSGTFLPDGRVRTGGTDQWLSVGTDGALRVATAKPTVLVLLMTIPLLRSMDLGDSLLFPKAPSTFFTPVRSPMLVIISFLFVSTGPTSLTALLLLLPTPLTLLLLLLLLPSSLLLFLMKLLLLPPQLPLSTRSMALLHTLLPVPPSFLPVRVLFSFKCF